MSECDDGAKDVREHRRRDDEQHNTLVAGQVLGTCAVSTDTPHSIFRTALANTLTTATQVSVSVCVCRQNLSSVFEDQLF